MQSSDEPALDSTDISKAAVAKAWRAVVVAAGTGPSADPHHDWNAEEEDALPGVVPSRRLLDTYGSSLIHTNRLISRKFERRQRKVPAHMPHFIDVDVLRQVDSSFQAEFEATSRNRFRSPQDLQFAFAYFQFIMEGGATQTLDLAEYWRQELDTNQDGYVWTHMQHRFCIDD